MNVKELKVNEMPGATQLLPIIQDSKVEVFQLNSAEELDFEEEVLKTVETLIIGCHDIQNWLEHAQNLTNRYALLKGTDIHDQFNDYALLMSHWIKHGREVGTCFTFELNEHNVDAVQRMVIKNFSKLTIRMRNKCKLVVSFDEIPYDSEREEDDDDDDIGTWRMKMEVV